MKKEGNKKRKTEKNQTNAIVHVKGEKTSGETTIKKQAGQRPTTKKTATSTKSKGGTKKVIIDQAKKIQQLEERYTKYEAELSEWKQLTKELTGTTSSSAAILLKYVTDLQKIMMQKRNK